MQRPHRSGGTTDDGPEHPARSNLGPRGPATAATGLPSALAAPATGGGEGGAGDTHQSGLELQGDGPQGVLQLLLFGDVHDDDLCGLAQLPDVPPHDLAGEGPL